MPLAYGIGGLISVPQGAISGQGAPASSSKGDLGQQYFDLSVSPPAEYIFNGLTWQSGGNAYATTSTPGIVTLSSNVTTDSTSTTLVPYAKAVYDYGQTLVLAGANIAQTAVTGITNLSTDAQAVAGTATVPGVTALAVQPSNLAAVFAAPPVIGGTTPAGATFTTIAGTAPTFSGLITGSASATITTGATALNLASDASTGAVNIGTGAGARTITIGNVTGATAVNVNTGTGSFTVTTTGAGDVVLNAADTVLIDSAGVLELNSSAGVIGIGNDAVAQNINVGTGAAARVITIGNSSGATQVVLNGGTAGINIAANAIQQPVVIGNTTGNTQVTIASGTGAIAIGTTIAKTITIGNVTGATAVNVNTGTGGTTYTTTNGIFTLATGTGAITMSNDATATTISIGAGAGVKTVTLGSTNTTSTTTINSGSGNVNVTGGHLSIATVAKTLLVNGGAATDFIGTGVLTLGTQTIANTNIATGDVIILTRTAVNASTTLGQFTYTISNATSFTVTSVILGTPGSTQTGDLSSYAYFIVRPT